MENQLQTKLSVKLKDSSTTSPKSPSKPNDTQPINPTLLLIVAKKHHFKTHNFSLPNELTTR